MQQVAARYVLTECSDRRAPRSLAARFLQDALWLQVSKGENNLEASLLVVRQGDVAVPNIFMRTTKAVRAKAELLLVWGEECWRLYQQVGCRCQPS